MKKLSYMACLLLASAAFTACDEDYTNWADPQHNPEDEAMTVSIELASVATMNLNEQEADSAIIATVSAIAGDCSMFACDVTLSAEGKTVNLPAVVKEEGLKVRLTELNRAVASLYGSQKSVARNVTVNYSPVVRTVYGEATTLNDNQQETMAVTPVATPAVDTEYYIVGGLNGWQLDKTTALKLEPESENSMIFAVIVSPEDKFEFKIIPGSTIDTPQAWKTALGSCKEMESSNLLAFIDKEGGEPGNLSCPGGKKYRIALDLENFTYSIREDLPVQMFINGSAYSSDWNWTDAVEMVPVTQTPGMFWSMQYYAAGEQIKFAPARKWESDFGYSDDTISAESIELANLTNEGGNIAIGKSGWYIVVVAITNDGRTISFLEPAVYLLGGLVESSWNCEEATRFTVPADETGEFVSPAATAAGTARICVTAVDAGSWWKSEFTLDLANGGDGTIVYRENKAVSDNLGELGYECAVEAGQKVYIDFTAGKGRVE